MFCFVFFFNCCTKISLTARDSRTQMPGTFLMFSFIEREELQSVKKDRERKIRLKTLPKIINVNSCKIYRLFLNIATLVLI